MCELCPNRNSATIKHFNVVMQSEQTMVAMQDFDVFKVSILFTYTRSSYVSLWLQGLNVHVHYLKLLIVYSLPFRWKYIHSGLNRTAAVFMTSTFPIRAHHHSINPSYITVTSVQISDCVACSSYSTINRSSYFYHQTCAQHCTQFESPHNF